MQHVRGVGFHWKGREQSQIPSTTETPGLKTHLEAHMFGKFLSGKDIFRLMPRALWHSQQVLLPGAGCSGALCVAAGLWLAVVG